VLKALSLRDLETSLTIVENGWARANAGREAAEIE